VVKLFVVGSQCHVCVLPPLQSGTTRDSFETCQDCQLFLQIGAVETCPSTVHGICQTISTMPTLIAARRCMEAMKCISHSTTTRITGYVYQALGSGGANGSLRSGLLVILGLGYRFGLCRRIIQSAACRSMSVMAMLRQQHFETRPTPCSWPARIGRSTRLSNPGWRFATPLFARIRRTLDECFKFVGEQPVPLSGNQAITLVENRPGQRYGIRGISDANWRLIIRLRRLST
jgi:hypothetical protein